MKKGLAIIIALVMILGGAHWGGMHTGVYAADSPPEITGSHLVILQGSSLDVMEGITATDDIDGDITSLVQYDGESIDTSEVGVYFMFYYVEDSSSQYGELLRYCAVVPDSHPYIWPSEIYAEYGMEFKLTDHVRAFDLEDGDISYSLEVLAGTVNVDEIGVYELTVEATDSDTHSTTATISVRVEKGGKDEDQPEIKADMVILKVGDEYNPLAGVTATDKTDGDISHLVIVEWDEVNTDKPGMYWTYYSVENSLGITGGNGRAVVVLADSNPMIFGPELLEIPLGSQLEEIIHIAEAYDYEDGNISDAIEVGDHTIDFDVAGEYSLTLVVEDSDHNIASLTIQVKVIDYSYPMLDVDGGTLYLGQEFNPLDYVSAHDAEDGDLTHLVEVVENLVDTTTEGSYDVTYRVTNSAGKTTSKTVTFEVVRIPEIVIIIIFGGNSYPVETNLFASNLRFTCPVLIPAGSLVGMEVYMDGELMGSVENVIMVDEILPNVTYMLTAENENELRAVAIEDEDGENGEDKDGTDYPADNEIPKTGGESMDGSTFIYLGIVAACLVGGQKRR